MKNKKTYVTKGQLARKCRVTLPTIDYWVTRGCPHFKAPGKLGRYRFEYDEVQIWHKANIMSRSEQAKPSGARERKDTAAAEKQEIMLARLKGELLDRASTHKTIFEAFRQTRDAVQGLADRLAGIVAAESDQHRCHAAISEECRRLLEDMAKSVEKITNGDFNNVPTHRESAQS